MLPKPPKRGPKPRRHIRRRVQVAKRSAKRGEVEKADRAWAAVVKVREFGYCAYRVSCWKRAIDAHHIFGKRANPELRHELANGIGLCREHHDYVHAHPTVLKRRIEDFEPQRWALLLSKRGRRPASERP